MSLPIPTDEVTEFAAIYERHYGVRLYGDRAREGATLYLLIFYLGTYGTRPGLRFRPPPSPLQPGKVALPVGYLVENGVPQAQPYETP